MIDAALFAKSSLTTLGMMALQGTILAIVAWAIVRGRMRPALQAAVWLIVLVKFILPWGPAMPWSLADLIAALRGDAVTTVVVGVPPSGVAPESAIASVSVGWLALAALWLAGAVFVLARAYLGHRRTARAIEVSRAAPSWARALLADLAGRRRVRLLVGDAATGPHVVGLVRPTIVIPPALLDDRVLLRAALLHELAHVHRLDAIGRGIQLAAHAVFWWCPVVVLVGRRLDHARESACDARALEVGQISRPAYARLLLQMAQLRICAHAASPFSSAMAGPHALDGRISSVLGPPMRSRLSLGHVLALVVFAAVALGGARSAEARGVETCVYSMQLAEALRQAHPEADLDQDGVLSHDEACDFQAELRRAPPATPDPQVSALLAEPLCCNCEAGEGLSAPAIEDSPSQCRVEGVDR